MPMILSPETYAAMLAEADAAGATMIHARASWIIANKTSVSPPATAVTPGYRIALLRCSPPPCVELWAVADGDISSDWEVV